MNEAVNISNDAFVKTDVSLQEFNTLAVPARAAYLVRCTSLDQLFISIQFAKNNALAVLILGEGSNTVFVEDFKGLVVLNRITGIELLDDSPNDVGSDAVTIKVAAGENWHDFVRYSLTQGWYGLENLALIPGLVGAAPIQNIGAYGVEVKDTIQSVHILNIENGDIQVLSNAECQFGYRDSLFKRTLIDKSVITAVVFKLSKSPACNVTYPALSERFKSPPEPMQVFNAVCDIRAAKLPMPDDIPNAGSFFKNPIVDQHQYAALKKRYPTLVGFSLEGDDMKLSAAWMIDQCGWKGKSVSAVYVHRDHALVVVNPNCQNGQAILQLARAIQKSVALTFDVVLEIEPRLY